MSKKRCNKCYKIQERIEYHKNKKNKDGLEYMCKKCSSKRYKKKYISYAYREQPKGFPYKSIYDPKYIKDRKELFKENGNGWWFFQGFNQQGRGLK